MHYLKIIIIFIITFVSISHTQAAGADNGVQTVCQNIGSIFDMVLRFGTAFRMIPVILTGKLLTNDVVYGQFIHFDIYLYSFWNLIKNIANYTLAFLFIIKILLLVKDGTDNIMVEVPKMLKGVIVSAILIQISRWAMGMLIDISSLGIATVASLPSQIVQANPQYQKDFEATLDQSYGRSVNFDTHEMDTIDTTASNIPTIPIQSNTAHFFMNTGLDQLLPHYNNVSGPLMIMGMSMMKFMDGYKQSSTTMTCTNIALSTLFRGMTLILYLLPIIILMLVSIVRVFKLRIYIIFSPFIALFYGLQEGNIGHQELLPGALDEYINQINIKDIISLIFQPVIIIGSLSVGIIFLVAMYATFALGGTSGHYEYKFDNGSSIHTIGNVTQFTHGGGNEFYLQGSLVGEDQLSATSPIGYIMMSIFTIMVLWGIVTIATSPDIIGNGMLSNWITQGTDLIKDTAKSIPVVPLPGIGALSMSNVEKLGGKAINSLQNTPGGIMKTLNKKNEEEAEKFAEMFGANKYKYDITKNAQLGIHEQLKKNHEVNTAKKSLFSFTDMHHQTQNIFDTLKSHTKDRKVDLNSSTIFTSALKDRYTYGGKKYLQATGVLNTQEASFKDKEGKILDDSQIMSQLFDFNQAKEGNSQGRFSQFVYLAMQDSGLRKRISDTIYDITKNQSKTIDELAQDHNHVQTMSSRRYYNDLSKQKIITDFKHKFDKNILSKNLGGA